MSEQTEGTYEAPSVEQLDTDNAPAEVVAGEVSRANL